MRLKILVIDDSATTRHATSRILEAAGHTVVAHHRAIGAGILIAKERPNLVLLDIEMEGMGGDSILKVIRNTEGIQDTFVALHSSLNASELRRLAQECGADAFVQRSDTHRLPELIQQWMRPG